MRMLGTRQVSLVGLLASVLALGSCGDEVNTTPCAPGESRACACTNGDQGAQLCKDDGTGFEACVCDGTSSNGTASNGTGAAAGTGGAGTGAAGTGGGFECAPGQERPCYEGVLGTEDVGPCIGGTETCLSTKVWGACVGQVLPSLDLCVTPDDEDCDGALPSCPTAWQTILGDAMSGMNAQDLAIGPDDSVVVVGQFTGSMVLGGQMYTAPSTGNGFVVKLSPQGDVDWVTLLTGLGPQVPYAVAVGPAGEIAVVGMFSDEINFGAGPIAGNGGSNGFLWRLDANGVTESGAVLAGTQMGNADILFSVAINSLGDVAVSGYYQGLASFGADELPMYSNGGGLFAVVGPNGVTKWLDTVPLDVASYSKVKFDPSGNLVVMGLSNPSGGFSYDFGTGPLSFDGFFTRYDGAGTRELLFTYGNGAGGSEIGYIFGGDLGFLPGGGLRMTHTYESAALDLGGGALGAHGSFVLDLDPTGAFVSSSALGDPLKLPIASIAVAPNGASVLGGAIGYAPTSLTIGSQTFSPHVLDAILIRLDPNGAPVEGLTFGAPNANAGFSVVRLDSSGTLVVLGYWYGDGVDLGFGVLPTGGGQAFVARLEW